VVPNAPSDPPVAAPAIAIEAVEPVTALACVTVWLALPDESV